jgi:electron-transferring-flavoprotein dehydrogenase
MSSDSSAPPTDERLTFEADIVCVGFGPATGGFLTTLSRQLLNPDGTPAIESPSAPGLPLQVMCYERSDDLGFGVSGAVTRGRSIRATFPDIDPTTIPLAAEVASEKLVYLLDPIGASRRPATLRATDKLIRWLPKMFRAEHQAVELPWTPSFFHKTDGLVLSIGQFNQWVASQLLGTAQLWPGVPVAEALIEGDAVVGVRLMDQGTDKEGKPESGFMPGMDVRAALTVVGDGPVGAVGRQLDREFGVPEGHSEHDWAVGMKMVVELPEGVDLPPGAVIHTFGYPEPEIFGFLYAHPDRIASLGVFVPSSFRDPARTAYRTMQNWMLHPYLWRYLKGGRLRSWGAKSLQESGRRGEPLLAGNGYARIGEGSGSTNVLTGSGVDEAWMTGVLLAEGVVELMQAGEPFTQENLDRAYVRKRRESWIETEGRVAARARDGFQRGVIPGLLGMALAGSTRGRLAVPAKPNQPLPTLEEYYQGKINQADIERIREECYSSGIALHDALMDQAGWPAVPYDGQLLMSHQDALLLGGKVQAAPGYADHVVFVAPEVCEKCATKVCIELCSGQAITPGPTGVPLFDREKCIHCGVCLWNCAHTEAASHELGNIAFKAGAGGLHSAEN